ncbi:DGQHR domain-containing protein DpdB [Vibrio breoganii]|uniref:DGQHR domain-containing protein DpdB n=1 Tax=Vibrio breoganii TaxID=553239 RepID=UPI0021C3BFE8|nr:DGQHR domain-containing protein DpdB [Vibrio breoganii]MDN3716555.1 DGQHR domain-containing protein DpdB [Vibrio breoganii]
MNKLALEVNQSKSVRVFVLSMNILEIESICTISRIFRDDNNLLNGYQRSEIKNHVDNIANYISSNDSIVPNSIIIGLKSSVRVRQMEGNLSELSFPNDNQVGVLVDGQQRVAALKLSGKEDYYFSVTVFINDCTNFERQQFLLINSAKPLSRSLIYELLPHASGEFSEELMKKKQPSMITQILNFDKQSPLYGLIKLTTNPSGIIADNSLMKLIDNSLREGALYEYRNKNNGLIEDVNRVDAVALLYSYFRSVKEVFDDDWGKKPKYSRLFHGVGIISLGQLFDEIYYSYKANKVSENFFEYSVSKLFMIKPYCHWSSGSWFFGNDIDGEPITRKWNQLQNLSQDISMVTKYLLKVYDSQERGVEIVKN